MLGWSVTVAFLGDHPPRAVVAVLFVLTMIGGPASMVSFALARDYNPARTIGLASGVVNVGGFAATVVIAMAFGWTLDLLGGTTPHAFRFALLVPVTVQAFGAVQIIIWYRRVRAAARERQRQGRPVPVRVGPARWWDL